MHTLKLNIEDSIFDKVIFFLKTLPKNKVSIVEEKMLNQNIDQDINYVSEDSSNTLAFSNHSANIIDEWRDGSEDEIWK